MEKENKIYLCGKIRPNDWRTQIAGDINNWDMEDDPEWYEYEHEVTDNITIVGPWFIACDHSCYHGERSHGMGANKHVSCTGSDPLTEKAVVDICKRQIEKSDVMFALIDDNTCYGSLWELGYAFAMEKNVIILFDNMERAKDMWFIANSADIWMTLNDDLELTFKKVNNTSNDTLDDIATWFVRKITHKNIR